MIEIWLVGALVAGGAWFVGWRLLSRRHRLPCPAWLGWMVELDNPFTRTNRASFIIDALAVEPGMRVLDAGCGPGRLTLPLAERVGPSGLVVGLDVQPAMLDRVRARVGGRGDLNIRLVAGLIEAAPWSEGGFDRVLLVTVLGEIPDQAAAFRRLAEALRPGGVLSVTELVFDPHFQSLGRVTALADAAGLERRAVHGGRLAYTAHFAHR